MKRVVITFSCLGGNTHTQFKIYVLVMAVTVCHCSCVVAALWFFFRVINSGKYIYAVEKMYLLFLFVNILYICYKFLFLFALLSAFDVTVANLIVLVDYYACSLGDRYCHCRFKFR